MSAEAPRRSPSPRGEPAARAAEDRDLFFTAAIFVLALLPRLYVAIALPREPVWDAHYYDFGARRIAAGLGYSDGTTVWHPWCHWPVGWSALLAGVYRVFGDGPHVATTFGAVVGALLPAAVHRFARLGLSRWRARAAALLCALHPGLVLWAALVMTEPLGALLVVVAGWLAVRDRARRPLRGAALAGFVLGLGTLVRPTSLALAPAVGLLLVDPGRLRRSLRAAISASALATACALCAVLPWTIRNCRVMDRCALVSTNGGWNLAIGAFPRATGRFETLRASDGCAVVTGQVQQDRCWRDRAIEWIREDPARWLALVPKKLGFTFDHESFPVEYLHEADPDRWPEPRRARARELLTTAHRCLLALAAFAFVSRGGASRRARLAQLAELVALAALAAWGFREDVRTFWPLAVAVVVLGALPIPGRPERGPMLGWALVAVASTLAAHAVFFGEDRYHLVVTPLLCVLAAAPLRRARVPSAWSTGTAPGARADTPRTGDRAPAGAPSIPETPVAGPG